MSHEKNDALTMQDYCKTNVLLALSKVGAVLVTQPVQVVLRDQQKKIISAAESYRQLRHNQPITAFYRGTGPGIIKEGLKNLIYKGALITGAPQLARKVLPQSLENQASTMQYHLIKATLAGFIAATSDAILGGPFETWATFRTTSQNEHANKSNFQEIRSEKNLLQGIKRTYKGFIPTVFKGTIAFSTMFALTDPIKQMTASAYSIAPGDKIPWYALGTSAIVCGIAVAITSSPFDIIKTQSQMPGGKDVGIYRALMNNYQMHGMKGVTAGLPLKALQVTIGWSLNFFASEFIKEKAQNKDLNSVPVADRQPHTMEEINQSDRFVQRPFV